MTTVAVSKESWKKRSLFLLKHEVLLSKTALRQLNSLQKSTQKRIKNSLRKLGEEPFKSRSGADIKKTQRLQATSSLPVESKRLQGNLRCGE